MFLYSDINREKTLYRGAAVTNIETLKAKLLARQTELSEIVNQYIADHEGRQTVERFIEVADIGERSVNDFLQEMDISVITQEVHELKSINAALRRIAADEYGVCSDCGEAIADARLQVNPSAERCVGCQDRYEKTHGNGGVNPKL